VRPVGASEARRVDVRIVAATNRSVQDLLNSEDFRQDLLYRLGVIHIALPPLRERCEDIPLLVEHFLNRTSAKLKRQVVAPPETIAWLSSLAWPGNVRELENVIERAVTLGLGPAVQPRDLPPHLAGGTSPLERAVSKEATLEDLEKDYIAMILRRTKGHQIRAASILGIDRRTLYRKIRRYGLKLGEE
jgi:transcriptional regulator with PAS, ATPase and Fis domain